MSEKYWLTHVEQILGGKQQSLLERAIALHTPKPRSRRKGFGFSRAARQPEIHKQVEGLLRELQQTPTEGQEQKGDVMEDFKEAQEIDEMIARLKDLTKDMTDYQVWTSDRKLGAMAPESQREKELFNLGLVLLESARWGDSGLCHAFIDAGFPVNVQHPYTKRTPLHVAAACGAGDFARTLVESGKADLLIRDAKGKLAFDLAYDHSPDLDLTDYLEQKTREQARERGIDPDEVISPDGPSQS
jgi:hypothetical protein